MEARNAAGRRVSLLNDDPSFRQPHYSQHAGPRTIHSAASPTRSGSSSPSTPELWRSDSYDSQMSNVDVISPLTPSADYGYPRTAAGGRVPKITDASGPKRPMRLDTSRANSHEDESAPASDRPAKRYPCRFRDSHGCEKTFTTSGHASRHSKIHTAEKAVQCTFAGCQKKFTRADNMKQHLETHYKDKSRSTTGHRAQKPTLADSRRNSTSSRSRSSTMSDYPHELEVRQYALPTPPMASPTGPAPRSAWEARGVNLPMHNRPAPTHAPKTGLDALAMAVACQEGS